MSLASAVALLAVVLQPAPAEPEKAEGTLKTRWASKVGDLPHREYPRPQMVRKNWTNLNGLWDLQILDKSNRQVWKGKILVPFPVESQLSRVQRRVPEDGSLVYRRSFSRPKGDRVLLHFGAVDWATTILINGKDVGSHQGGYDPFSFDITDGLRPTGNVLEVRVKDPTDRGSQPRGKQVNKPQGIFYTPTSGIWQTVWLEPVPRQAIGALELKPQMDGTLTVIVKSSNAPGLSRVRTGFSVELVDGRQRVRAEGIVGGSAVLKVRQPKLWSPSSPTLYPIRVRMGEDEVESYVAFRDVRVGKARDGKTRILMNGQPLFLIAPLDQGFWPDGLYTAPTDEALKYDLDVTKRMGFNSVRKHVKVEPARWYYWCDKLGLAVMQDMPSMSGFIGSNDPDLNLPTATKRQFRTELESMIRSLWNHPSIVMWVPFNEGWGQHDTVATADFVKKLDPSRIVNSVSGWTDRKVGDVHDIHVYPGPGSPRPEDRRAAVLGEFGGLGLPVPENSWRKTGWGYQSFQTKAELTDRFVGLFRNLHFLIQEPGLSAAVYTQTTDVETEINGLMSYDRALIKLDEGRVRRAIQSLFQPAPELRTVLPSSQSQPQTWEFRTATNQPFRNGQGGFGTRTTPGASVGTVWNTPEIWIRRSFELDRPVKAQLWIHHDEDAEVFIDDNLVRRFSGYSTSYFLDDKVIPLAKGRHTILIRCKQTQGGQYIDAGLVEVVERTWRRGN
jgi:hypothetical protein